MIVTEPPKTVRIVLASQKVKIVIGLPFIGRIEIGDPISNEILEGLKKH